MMEKMICDGKSNAKLKGQIGCRAIEKIRKVTEITACFGDAYTETEFYFSGCPLLGY